MIRYESECAHDENARQPDGSEVCVLCGAETSPAVESEEIGEEELRGALLSAAQRDRALSLIERAAALQESERVNARSRDISGMIESGCLTETGRAAARQIIPPPEPNHFPAVVADLLRRLRGAGHSCSEVVCSSVVFEGRPGFRVSWEGDGWLLFSRRSYHPDATRNREELESAAEDLGLCVQAEAAPTLLVVEPSEECEIVIKRDTLRKLVREATPMERAVASVARGCEDDDRARDEAMAKRGRTRADFLASLDRAVAHRRSQGLPAMLTFEDLIADLPSD